MQPWLSLTYLLTYTVLQAHLLTVDPFCGKQEIEIQALWLISTYCSLLAA